MSRFNYLLQYSTLYAPTNESFSTITPCTQGRKEGLAEGEGGGEDGTADPPRLVTRRSGQAASLLHTQAWHVRPLCRPGETRLDSASHRVASPRTERQGTQAVEGAAGRGGMRGPAVAVDARRGGWEAGQGRTCPCSACHTGRGVEAEQRRRGGRGGPRAHSPRRRSCQRGSRAHR